MRLVICLQYARVYFHYSITFMLDNGPVSFLTENSTPEYIVSTIIGRHAMLHEKKSRHKGLDGSDVSSVRGW
jgi:hypothetical protein